MAEIWYFMPDVVSRFRWHAPEAMRALGAVEIKIEALPDGSWQATTIEPAFATTGHDKTAALEAMRERLRGVIHAGA